MDYVIKTNSSVDNVMIYTDNKEFSHSAQLIADDKISRSWQIKLKNKNTIILWNLQYGMGGTAEYQLKDLVSKDAVIVNTPEAIKAVLVELPDNLNRKFLNLKPVRKFSEETMELYDMEKNNRNWIQYVDLPESILEKPVIVHCYEYEKLEIIKPKL